MNMRIGIIGSGNVGGALGTRWAAAGHHVIFSSRSPESPGVLDLVRKAGHGARADTAAGTVAASDVLLLATPWEVTRAAATGLGPLGGKVLIDATNPLLPGLAGIEYGTATSGAEQIASWVPGSRVVKAFNTIGFNVMANPRFPSGDAALLYCGDDADAKQTVRQLALDLGFDPHDAGPLSASRLLEPFALLWITLAMKQGYGREIAFQLLRR